MFNIDLEPLLERSPPDNALHPSATLGAEGIMRVVRFSATMLVLLFCAGCGASIELQKGERSLDEMLPNARFYLVVEDGSGRKPDNWDGYVNLLWTNEDKRTAIVAEHVKWLVDGLEQSGFIFVDSEAEGNVRADLKLKSVRYDPVGGWITDDAKVTYTESQTDEPLGAVIADEIWVTPTVKMIFEALLKGSLQLWGQSRE